MRLFRRFITIGTPVGHKFFLGALFIGMISSSLLISPSPDLATDRTNSSTITVYSRILDEERTLSVYLPDSHHMTSRAKYPVLYILDAEGKTVFLEAISTVKNSAQKGLMPEVIVVGIWNTSRNRDMIPFSVPHRPGSGGSQNFLAFIVQELKPYIQKNNRASDKAILYGMSNSALFAVYALLENPKTFDGVIASSPMIGHCPDFIQKKAEIFINKDLVKSLSLYMIYGDEDSRRVTDYVPDFQKYLTTHAPKGFTCRLEILEGEGHVPASSLARGLAYIFGRSHDF
jgi:predicted alpha/beta superfamily hydrolase